MVQQWIIYVIEFISISSTIFLFSMLSAKTESYSDEMIYLAAFIVGAVLGRIVAQSK